MNIDPTLMYGYQPPKTAGEAQKLGKDDFLKILVTQLKTQSPLDPMKDREFISQMATMSSLEQTQNMNDAIQNFVGLQSQNLLNQSSDIIGKQVSWNKPTGETDEDGNDITEEVEATVASVMLKNNNILYVTRDGESISPSQLLRISEATGGGDSGGDSDTADTQTDPSAKSTKTVV